MRGGKAFFSFSTATNEIARVAYKENMQTLDCCELCSLVRDKTIISSPSRPNPQAACRVMIGTVLSHLLCMPLGSRHSQHTRAAAAALGAQPGGAGRGAPHASPPPPGRHIWNDPQLLPLLAPSHLFFLYLLRKHFPPSHTYEKLRLSVSDGMVHGQLGFNLWV